MKAKYSLLAVINFLLGACAICIYLPYTSDAFNIKGMSWLGFAKKLLKDNYYNVSIYLGIIILGWIIAVTLLTLFSRPNFAKLMFKLSAISSLIIPLVYVMALKYDFALEFWIKYIAPYVKMICYIFLSASVGSLLLAIVLNFTQRRRANLHLITQALAMLALFVLMLIVFGWCGWNIGATVKLFGVLMALMAVYLPLSIIILIICAKNRL